MTRELELLELAWGCMQRALATDDVGTAERFHRMACEYVAQAGRLTPSLTLTGVVPHTVH